MGELVTLDQRVEATISEAINQHPIIQEALDYIEKEHSTKQYHNLRHTLDVTRVAVMLAIEEDLSLEEMGEICIAATHHDYYQGPDHEAKSAQVVREKMTNQGYKPKSIDNVAGAIKSTKVNPVNGTRNEPANILEKILQDADVANFGRGDSIALFFAFYKELTGKEYGLDSAAKKKAFLQRTIDILKNHRWNTNTAKKLFEEQRTKNLSMLEEELVSLNLSETDNS